jgi:hypothetical protein
MFDCLTPRPARIPVGTEDVVGTANEGYVVFPEVVHGKPGDAVVGVGVVDEVVAYQFVLSYRVTIQTLRIFVDTAESGKVFGVGIYDKDGNLLFETGARSTTSTGLQSVALGVPVSLGEGVYFIAWTCNGTTARIRGMRFSEDDTLNEMLNANATKRAGTATAAATPGEMNAALGTITQDLTMKSCPVLYAER